MSIASKFCKQKAMYFAPLTRDKHGNPSYDLGVLIRVRWENKLEEVITADAKKHLAKHHVMASQDLEVGGLLWLGSEEDWNDLGLTTVTASTPNHHRIAVFSKLPNLRAKDYLREAWM